MRALLALSVLLFSLSDAALGGTAPVETSPRLDLRGPALPPLAYTKFCLAQRAGCGVPAPGGKHVTVIAENRWDTVEHVNSSVNSQVIPTASPRDVTEPWRYGATAGDCVDFAMEKRRRLLKSGLSAAAVLLAEVIVPGGEHHLVVVTRWDHGDFVLDNLHPDVRPWHQTGYRWVRIQSPSDPRIWRQLKDRALDFGS